MREYIFTPHEKQMLVKFLKDGMKGDGFRTLMTRIKQNAEEVRQDLRLMEAAFEKYHK